MFRQALGYPTRPPEGGRSVLAGGFALIAITACFGVATLDAPYAYLAAVGLLPWLLVRGYYVRTIRTTIGRDRPLPPRFGDLKRLLLDGVTAVLIAVVYLFPGAVVLGPLAVVRAFEPDVVTSLTASVPGSAVTALSALVGLLAVVALMSVIGALYVLPVAVARFAHSGEWRRALELRTVVDGALTEDYVIAWGVTVVLQALLLPVAYLLRVVLFGFFLHFIVAVGVRYCYGQVVGAALELDPVGSDHADARTGGPDADVERDPVPAFTRVDTARWGVRPGEDDEPMSKSRRFGGEVRSRGSVVPPEPTDEPGGQSAEVTVADAGPGRESRGAGDLGADGTDDPDGSDDMEDPEGSENGERWDLPSAVERVVDDETGPDR
jgi:hypothetical protein